MLKRNNSVVMATGVIACCAALAALTAGSLGSRVSVKATAETTFISAEAGNVDAAAIDSDGKLYVWGDNAKGQLGNGTTTASVTPICLTTISDNPLYNKTITSVSLGNTDAAAIDSDGNLYTWGYGYNGQLGVGSVADSSTPVCLTTLSGSPLEGKAITSVSCGTDSTVAIVSGSLYSWGNNDNGQLGNGTKTKSGIPASVSLVGASERTVTSVSCGYASACAIDSVGELHAWGRNAVGQLGDNTKTTSTLPIDLGVNANVVSFVNQLFTYKTCTDATTAYTALNATYSGMTSGEKTSLLSAWRYDYADNAYDDSSYSGDSMSTKTTAMAKWTAVASEAGHPLSGISLLATKNEHYAEYAIIGCVSALAIASVIFVLAHKHKEAK